MYKTSGSIFLATLIFFAATTHADICKDLVSVVRSEKKPSSQLKSFLDKQWQYQMQESPEGATYAGEPGHDDKWSDISLAAIERRRQETYCQLQVLQKIPSRSLKGEEKINFELAERSLKLAIEGLAFDSDYLVLDQMGGVHQGLADILMAMPAVNLKSYENMLARMSSFPVVVEQNKVLLKEGLKHHATAVKMFLQRVPGQIDKLLPENPELSPYYKPFSEIKADLTTQEKQDMQRRALEGLKTKIYPSLQDFKKFLVEEYIPNARENVSFAEMPNGKAWYNYLVKTHTTTNKSAAELHQLGLSEVARINEEMLKIKEQAKFKGDLKEFNKFLLKDRQFFYKTKEELMMGYRDIAKRIDPELPRLFKTLPQLTYGVREMPEFKAKEAPAAYYEGGSMQSGRAGFFTANTYDLSARPKWAMEVLTLHEAVPGHHLQISIAQELKSLPKFRTEGGFTAFVEGWGLYSESLGDELGLYQDPYSKYGQLSFEMWRAVRLVVDTGIHAKGWTRQQAIDYMMDHVAKTKLETEVEVDRYITWPGQALAYKVGQLKFLELRKKAQAALGPAFNIREFHDEILRHGALPMDLVDELTSDWIAQKQKKN